MRCLCRVIRERCGVKDDVVTWIKNAILRWFRRVLREDGRKKIGRSWKVKSSENILGLNKIMCEECNESE